MDFKAATDRLIGRRTLGDIADACGVSVNLIQRARMSGRGARRPPPGWRMAVARLSRERSRELATLAEALEREAGG